jgi:hypothetical protein
MQEWQMSKTVIERVIGACEKLGEVDLAGISLESADPRLLDVTQLDLDRHVAMQPSAVAYYGALVKDAGRRLDAMSRHDNRWRKKKMAEAKVAVMNSTTNPRNVYATDIEARFITDNEEEIEKREKQLEKLQVEYDTLSVWYDAWKQKSFSLREHVSITEDERFNSSSSAFTGKSGGSEGSTTSRSKVSERCRGIRERMKQGASSIEKAKQ